MDLDRPDPHSLDAHKWTNQVPSENSVSRKSVGTEKHVYKDAFAIFATQKTFRAINKPIQIYEFVWVFLPDNRSCKFDRQAGPYIILQDMSVFQPCLAKTVYCLTPLSGIIDSCVVLYKMHYFYHKYTI